MNPKLFKIFTWINTEMEFDKWYKVQTIEQRELIKKLIDSGLIPDCEFNSGYTKFQKSTLAYEIIYRT